jgi:hypothetical protein
LFPIQFAGFAAHETLAGTPVITVLGAATNSAGRSSAHVGRWEHVWWEHV